MINHEIKFGQTILEKNKCICLRNPTSHLHEYGYVVDYYFTENKIYNYKKYTPSTNKRRILIDIFDDNRRKITFEYIDFKHNFATKMKVRLKKTISQS